MMQSKRQRIIAAAEAGDWRTALAIAASVNRRRLGEHGLAIVRAHEASWRPEWSRQLGRDPAADIEAGIQALCSAFKITRDTMTYTDRKSISFDLKRCVTEALLANDRDWLRQLTDGELEQPLAIRVPGWSQVEVDMPAEAVAAARRILAEHLPAEMLYRIETEDIATVCAALARVFHTSEPAAFVGHELRGFDDVLRELGAMVHRRDDGHHYIEWGDDGDGDQTLVPWFSDVLDELACELHRRADEAKAS